MDGQARMLFVLEGNTDIRFVSGLSEYFKLSLIGSTEALNKSGGLKDRIKERGLDIEIIEIPGGRLIFQWRSFLRLLKLAQNFDFFFSQENLRGSLSAGLASKIAGLPLYTHSGIPPREYYRCRYTRGQISSFKYFIGDSVIRILLTLNSWLADFWFVLGPFLYEVFSPYKKEIGLAHYYGVDTELYIPVTAEKKASLREDLGFSSDQKVIFFSSRVSHEKDPETVLKAVAHLNETENLNLVLMNLSGGHEKMRELAKELGLRGDENWLITKPPAHPMKDLPRYYQASDLVIQASLEEGLGLSPLEAMTCEIPVIASDVGGMKAHLHPFCEMVPVADQSAMEEAIKSVISKIGDQEKNKQLEKGRRYVQENWNRTLAFKELAENIHKLLNKSSGKSS